MTDPGPENSTVSHKTIIDYEPSKDGHQAPVAKQPNGLAALAWAVVAVALAPYVCLSLPIGLIAVMAAAWTLRQPKNARRAYRRCAIAALAVVAAGTVALIAGVVQFFGRS